MKMGPFVYIVGCTMPFYAALHMGACAPRLDVSGGGNAPSSQSPLSVDGNDTNTTVLGSGGSDSGSKNGNSILSPTISLPDLGNITIPNFPLPKNLAALLQALQDPAILNALQEAIKNNVCSDELNQLDTQQAALLNNLGALLGQGPAPDLQPVTDAANAFLKCIGTAVPDVGKALSEAGLGSSSGKSVVRANAVASVGEGTALPVPGSIGELVAQLTAPEVMSALQRAREAHTCRSELEALEGTSGPVLSRATTALETLQSRPAADLRPAASALQAFMQCMAR